MAHLIQLLGKWNRIENSYHQTIVCMQVRCCICLHNFVGFLFDQQKKQYQVHRLVLFAYDPLAHAAARERWGDDMVVMHLNGDHTDNRCDNLAFGNQKINMKDRVKHARERQARRDAGRASKRAKVSKST